MSAEFRVDNWREITAALKQLGPKANRAGRARLRRPAQKLADVAKQNALSQGLRRSGALVDSIRVSATQTGVSVYAGGAKAPYARVHEFGGRWPIFATGPRATWTWYPPSGQSPARPFFYPAVESEAPAVVDELMATVEDVAAGLGLDVDSRLFNRPTLTSL